MTLSDAFNANRFPTRMGLAVCLLALGTTTALAQDGRPGPAAPEPQTEPEPIEAPGDDAPDQPGEPGDDAALDAGPAPDAPLVLPSADPADWGTRPVEIPAGKIKLAFDDVGVEETIPWIAEMTGKVVMPVNLQALKNRKITLMNDRWIEQGEALDLLFQAFRLNDVGVIEKDDVVIVGIIDQIVQLRQMPVLTADVDVRHRKDKGSLVVKIFQLQEVKADEVGDQISDNLPSYASLTVDPNSNQIVVMGDIALCQHLETLISELDNNYVQAKTQTFRLAYADATEVSENILDLFETTTTGSSRPGQTRRSGASGRTPGRPNQPVRPGAPVVGPEIEMRVTVNLQQNSLTVSALPAVVDEIAKLIATEWDLPRSPGTSRIYTLQYTDPLKVAEKLKSLLGEGSGGGSVGGRGRGAAGGGGGSVDQILSGIYRLEPYPDTGQLLVFCKTEESLDFLDEVIESLDQPSTIGLPFVTELKHANAIELAEELNALLSEAGAGVTIDRPGEGLSGRPEDGDTGGAGTGGDAGAAGTLSFPWQRGGRQRDDVSPESSLIGRVRIVPIVRQNALAVLCPAPHRAAVQQLIEYFDRPGRQVMISAIIAEVELTDDLSLGLRFSSSDDIVGGNPDYQVGSNIGFSGQNDPFLDKLFDTSILDVDLNINVVLQALQQNTNVKIIQEPIVFTADNQEALFFDGQDIPFITDTVISTDGDPTQSFDYREVGVTLNVRPRITVERDVDLEILLELSSVVPGVTLFGGAIIDRRETRTHVVLQNGQTIVISGILREDESKITRKVPLLGDIPFIGEIFKSRENSTTTTELIAFITPYVVDNPSENSNNFQRGFLDRLDVLTSPVDQQAEERLRNPEKHRERLLPESLKKGRDATPEPPQSGDDARQPLTPPVDDGS
jgi:general secretion pathway protein D